MPQEKREGKGEETTLLALAPFNQRNCWLLLRVDALGSDVVTGVAVLAAVGCSRPSAVAVERSNTERSDVVAVANVGGDHEVGGACAAAGCLSRVVDVEVDGGRRRKVLHAQRGFG